MSGFQTLITQLLCFIADGYKETTANRPGKGGHKKYRILRGTRPLRGGPPAANANAISNKNKC